MKIYPALLLGLFSALLSSAQEQKKIDSLKHELTIAKADTQRVLLLSEIGDRYRHINVDSAIFFDQRAILLARKINFPKGEVQSLRRMAFVYRISGNTPKAMEINFKTLKLAVSKDLKYDQASIVNQIGGIYSEENDYHKALFFLKEAYKLSTSIHFRSMLGLNQNAIGRTYYKMNQLDSALYYCLLAQKNIQTQEISAINTIDIGLIYSKKGDKKRALSYFLNSVNLLKGDDFYDPKSRANYQTALIYRQSKQIDSAIYYANHALTAAQKGNFYSRIIDASKLLSELYETKDMRKALQYNNMAIAAKDSLYLKGKRNAIQNLTDFDEKERQYEIETAQTAYKNQVKQVALLSGLAGVLLIALLLYWNAQKEKRAKNLLREQKEKIESTLSQLKSTQAQLIQSEKLASLGELTAGIAHEIQNPLNFVNNFSELSVDLAKELKEEIKKPEKDWELIDDLTNDLSQNQEKINHHGKRAASIVKGMLEHSKASTGKKELTDINALVDEYARLAYSNLRSRDDNFTVVFETHLEDSIPKMEVIPQDMGRVLLNLINNAFWAVKTVEKPLVTIKTEKSDNQAIIKVSDNGIGMSEVTKDKIFQPFFTTKPTGQGIGLGLSLSYDIVKAHGGELKVETMEGEGSIFIILLSK
jgi:two-component system NtrC family sensor kinase